MRNRPAPASRQQWLATRVSCLAVGLIIAAGCDRETDGRSLTTAAPTLRHLTSTPKPNFLDPTPTLKPTLFYPTSTPGVAELVMDVSDAAATAEAWSIPAQELRIERAGYLDSGAAIEAARGNWRSLTPAADSPRRSTRGPLLFGGIDFWLDDWLATNGGPVIMLEVSQRGMDVLGVGNGGHFVQATQPQLCMPVASGRRATITAFFDPRRGTYLGHDFGVAPAAWWSGATAEVPFKRITSTPRPTDTPSQPGQTPSPTHTPRPTSPSPLDRPAGEPPDPAWSPQPLAEGEYPAGVAEMIHAWPLVKGSTWTYRLRAHSDSRSWRTEVITETVMSASRRGTDVMEVSLSHEGGSTYHSHWARSSSFLVVPDRVVDVWGGPAGSLNGLAAILDATDRGDRVRLEQEAEAENVVRLPLALDVDEVPYSGASWWSAPRMRSVDSGAGRFEGCLELVEIFNVGNIWGHWLCPGVGIARHELPGCGSSYGSYAVMDLIRWSVPPMRAVH